jgi:hypothetical protein
VLAIKEAEALWQHADDLFRAAVGNAVEPEVAIAISNHRLLDEELVRKKPGQGKSK